MGCCFQLQALQGKFWCVWWKSGEQRCRASLSIREKPTSHHSTICMSALLATPSFVCFRNTHWNHMSWNTPNHFFALNIDREKKLKHKHNSKEAETFRLSLPQPEKFVSATLTKSFYSQWILKRRGIKKEAFTSSQKIKTKLMQIKPFHFSRYVVGKRWWF